VALTAVATLTVSSCGSKRPVEPTPPVTISSIAPTSGPSIGGTPVTVTGTNFSAGATLSIGGAAAQNVTVIDQTTIAATTGPSVSGTADVIVVSGGQTATLRGGYTYLLVENAPPVISSVTARGTRANEPANFADLDEEITVTANVSDAETPVAQLTFEWAADMGTFTGTGPVAKWRAPRDLERTPVSNRLTVTVIEQYQSTDENGAPVTREHRVTGTVTIRVHNSRKEVSDLVGEFLNDFANSNVAPEAAVRNFSDNKCGDGKASELNDVRENRAMFVINSHVLGLPPTITFNFDGTCPFRARPGDACAQLSCSFVSTERATGAVRTSTGTCHVTSVYDTSRWQLCWSDFREITTTINGKIVPGARFPF